MHTARSAMPTGLALTTAVSLAFTPLMLPAPAMRDIALPNITAPRLQLAAAINPADVDALVANLNAALNSASGTVTNLVGAPGQTVSGALNSAVSLNDTLWAGLIDATDSKPLLAIIKTLKASAGNGLSQLATTVDSANGDVVLATGQLTDLLTSTITGSLGSVLHAVATVVNNPLALPSYTGLINAPIDIAGLLLTQGIGAVDNLGTNVLSVTNTVVRGVTAQVSNALDTFNGLIGAGKTLTDLDLINGLLTAVQGIVSAPVTAAVAGVNGLSTTIVNAASTALGRVADGASDAIATWIGDGTGGGAIQHVINTIGSAPLSAASYTRAISVLVGAGISTVTTAVHTVGSIVIRRWRESSSQISVLSTVSSPDLLTQPVCYVRHGDMHQRRVSKQCRLDFQRSCVVTSSSPGGTSNRNNDALNREEANRGSTVRALSTTCYIATDSQRCGQL